MAGRDRVLGLKRAATGERIDKMRPELVKAAGYALNFVLGFVMTIPRVYGALAPFGIGMVARGGTGIGGAMCLVGAVMGYLITGGFEWGIRYVAAAVLVFTAEFVFGGTKISRRRWFMPVLAAAVAAVTGFLNSFEYSESLPAVVLMLTEVLLVGSSAYFFDAALAGEEKMSRADDLRFGTSLMILLACCLMVLDKLVLLDVISVGRLLAVLFVMVFAMKGDVYAGCAAGAALGLAMDMSYGTGTVFVLTYTFAGLISGLFSKHGKLLFVLSYIAANTVTVLWSWNAAPRIEGLYECFAAAVIFMLIPNSFLGYVGSLVSAGSAGMGESGLRRYSAKQIEKLSGAFRDIYDTVKYNVSSGINDNDIAGVFDRAADQVCVSCRNKALCWNKNSMDTLSVLNDATAQMQKRGYLIVSDISAHFRENCDSIEKFVSAVNAENRSMLYRRQFKTRLSENRSAAYAQFADVSSILDRMSKQLMQSAGPDPLAERRLLRYLRGIDVEAEATVFRDENRRLHAVIESGKAPALARDKEYLDKLSSALGVRLCAPTQGPGADPNMLVLAEAEPLAVSVGIAATKKKGENVSGDRGTYFKTDQGVLCVILSDGMGSGENAAKESIAAVRILESFLRSGVKPETAMKILNSVMLLKNGEDWGYTTVDLMCIDLFSGETCFYKYGAAPSYVKTGKTIRRVRGESFAAGVCSGEAAAPDVVRMKLKSGSIALVVSDGMLPENEDAWLRDLVKNWDGGDSKALAKEALQRAIKQYGCSDDMTVLAVFVDERL